MQSSDIKGFYKNIWKGYDFINNILTFGLDYRWRKKASDFASETEGDWLDMCCGTGEMLKHLGKNTNLSLTGCDFSYSMMNLAEKKYKDAIYCSGNASSLPFKSESFAGTSISFATRNLQNAEGGLLKVFSELHRVLEEGGILVHLETSQPSFPFIRWGFHLFTRFWVSPVGRIMSGDKDSYTYLASSMRGFHGAGELTSILQQVGFKKVKCKKLLFGSTAIHLAVK